MAETKRIAGLVIEAVRAAINERRALDDFLSSVEARRIAEQVVILEYRACGKKDDEALANVRRQRTWALQHAGETRRSIADAIRSLRDLTGDDSTEFAADILDFEQGHDAKLVWRLLAHIQRSRAALKGICRGIPETKRKHALRETQRISQMLLMIVHLEIRHG